MQLDFLQQLPDVPKLSWWRELHYVFAFLIIRVCEMVLLVVYTNNTIS